MKTVTIETFNASHDLYGNPIAHYIIWGDDGILLTNQNGNRAQIGYSSNVNESALVALRGLGIEIETKGTRFDRNSSTEYQIKAINDMPDCFHVVNTDLFCGEMNYSTVTNFKVYAKTERGAVTKVAKHTGLNFRKHEEGVYHSISKLSGLTVDAYHIQFHDHLECTVL